MSAIETVLPITYFERSGPIGRNSSSHQHAIGSASGLAAPRFFGDEKSGISLQKRWGDEQGGPPIPIVRSLQGGGLVKMRNFTSCQICRISFGFRSLVSKGASIFWNSDEWQLMKLLVLLT